MNDFEQFKLMFWQYCTEKDSILEDRAKFSKNRLSRFKKCYPDDILKYLYDLMYLEIFRDVTSEIDKFLK